MDRDKFEALVEQTLADLPEAFRERLTNVAIIVEDLPPAGTETKGVLLGLFHGVPRTEKSVFSSTPPDNIYLYQKNIEAVSRTEADLRRQIRDTLLHEVGHYFGLNEEELRGI
jgi:predicted Zn-dependent protease with MMP-like domain